MISCKRASIISGPRYGPLSDGITYLTLNLQSLYCKMVSADLDSLGTRVTVLETRMNGLESVLAGQREAVDRLLDVAYKNSREMAQMKGDLSSQGDRVVSMISAHAAEEAKERQKSTSYAFWTLVTVIGGFAAGAATVVFG